MKSEIRVKVEELCNEYCACEVKNEEELLESGILSSVRLFELICEFEGEFCIEFDRDEITNMDNFSSVDKMIELVEKKCLGVKR